MLKHSLLFTALMAVAGIAPAQSLPKPAEFYFDADANATKPVIAVKETGDVATQKLAKMIERGNNVDIAAAQLAHMAMESGRAELGRQLYARALSGLETSDGAWRAVLWNYGWDLFRAGDDKAALEQWRLLLSSRGVTASWMPPTFALVLWSLDRKEEAVQWYGAAVRSEPQQWRTAGQFARLLPAWSDQERALLAEVQAAWAANPPAWP
jgi:tetratricopeptide (TPR) repeat protein